MGWEVYSSSGGEIYKTTYDNNKQTSSTEFLYGNPIDQSQKNYKIWKNSIADIQDQVSAFINASGGVADIQSPKDYREANKSSDEKITDIVKNSVITKENIVDTIIKEVPEVSDKVLAIMGAPFTAETRPTTTPIVEETIPDSPVIDPTSAAQMGADAEMPLPYTPPTYQGPLTAKKMSVLPPIGPLIKNLYDHIFDGDDKNDDKKKDGEPIIEPKILGEELTTPDSLDALMPSVATQQFDPFSELGWRDIYQGYTNQLADLDTPDKYRWVIEQGMSNNPLLRTAQTQFLLQGDYNVLSTDPELGGYHTSKVLQGYDDDDRGKRNPYWEFLSTYQPIKGRELISSIDNVIDNINAPAGSIVGTDVSPEDYTDLQNRQIMLRQRFGIGNQAAQAQTQLAALPILEHTSPALRNEIAGVVSTLHQNWLVNPNRPEDENWLEYTRRNNFFGLVPENLLLRDLAGSQD